MNNTEININKIYNKCLRCGRKLKNEDAKILGFGTICWKKFNEENKYKPLFEIRKE